MGVSAEFLPEFDVEMASTRRTLERIPEDKLAWKPHEKSMLLGRLAGHIAELPGMGVSVMKEDALDFESPTGGNRRASRRWRSRRSMCWNYSIRMLPPLAQRLRPRAMSIGLRTGSSIWERRRFTKVRAWGRCGEW